MNFEQLLKTFDLTNTDALMIPFGAIFFFLLYKFLAAKLFLPFMKLVEAREGATTGAEESATQSSKKAAEILSEYELALRDSRARVMEERDRVVGIAKKEASQFLDKARDEAEEILRSARWEMASSLDALKKSALAEGDRLVEAVVEKVKAAPTQARTH